MRVLVIAAWYVGGCNGDVFVNQLASFGGATAGRRGTVRVVFINNTPHRAVFVFGTYDQNDRQSEPDFSRFGIETGDTVLGGHDRSAIQSLPCGRVFSIGSRRMISLIDRNLPDAVAENDPLEEGVTFVEESADPDAGPAEAGRAAPFEALLGADFPCDSLLIIRFEPDDLNPGSFVIDFQYVPSGDDR